mmetsp:Transcript_21703/g.66875  ORF Transcript_21703/g.66875 Transcript_21703/m.66875 type:complete len:242 (+) Transcript_21703:36-761(+)
MSVVRCCESAEELRREVAAHVVREASGRSPFVVAVSGGSMPTALSGLLDVDMNGWDVVFADERLVSLDSPDSNYKACMDALFARAPRPPRVHAVDVTRAPEAAAAAYDEKFRSLGGKVHLALLGAGPDGHTASLFPGHPLFVGDDDGRLVRCITDSPKPPPERVTLTRTALAAADSVVYVATGASKADLFAQLFRRKTGDDGTVSFVDSEPPLLPVARVRAKDGSATFFVDAPALAKVPSA